MGRTINYAERIKESEEELLKLEKAASDKYVRDKLRYLRYLKTGLSKSQKEAGSLIGLKERQSQRLWQQYELGGLSALAKKNQQGYWGQLSSVEQGHLLNYLQGDDMITQGQAAEWIQGQYGVHYTQAGIHYLFKRLKVKLKTGRPSNVQQDEAGMEDFKKTLPKG